MTRGKQKLKEPEKWALDKLHSSLSLQFPEGYEIEYPKQDPPDCIAVSKSDPNRRVEIEFSALGPSELFEFYNVVLKRKPPYIAKISIPYEPEFWMRSLLKKKKYKITDKYKLLVTHFSTHFTLPNMSKSALTGKLEQQPMILTQDMAARFARTVWEQGVGISKAVVFVQPDVEPVLLTTIPEQPASPEISIKDGYPTIQLIFFALDIGVKTNQDSIPTYELSIKPKNNTWKNEDKFRLSIPDIGKVELVNKNTGKEHGNVGRATFIMGPSMPKLTYTEQENPLYPNLLI